MQSLLKNYSYLLCIYLYIVESQDLAIGWAEISIPNTCPQQGRHPQTRMLRTVCTQVWQMPKGSHCPLSFSLCPAWIPHFTPGPLSPGFSSCSTVEALAASPVHGWGFLPQAKPALCLQLPAQEECFIPMLQRPPLSLLHFVHVFPTEVPAEGSTYTWSDQCWAEIPRNLVSVLLLT